MGKEITLKDGEFKKITHYDPLDSWVENSKYWNGLDTFGKNSDTFTVDHAPGQKVQYFEDEKTGKMYVFKAYAGKIVSGAEVEFDGKHSAHGINTSWSNEVDAEVVKYSGPAQQKIITFLEQKIAGKVVEPLDIATAEKAARSEHAVRMDKLLHPVNITPPFLPVASADAHTDKVPSAVTSDVVSPVVPKR